MPRRVPSTLEKLTALEAKKQSILLQRKAELLNIIESCNAFTIDDTLLAGFLLFATHQDNQNHQILKEFKALAAASTSPGLLKRKRQKSTKVKEGYL